MLTHHKIKELRERKNISQETIASEIGISQNTYHLIETGKSKLKLEHVIKIAEILKVELSELINDEASIQNINNSTVENGGQLIQNVQNIVHNFSVERKEIVDYLKNLVENQIDKKDEQINKLIDLLKDK